jgi:hypothetical protein
VACNLKPFSIHKDPAWNGVLNLDILINRNGTVGEVTVKPAPPKEIESSVTERVKEWVFEPSHETSSVTTRKQSGLGITCYPLSTNEEGSCSFKLGSTNLTPATGGIIGGVIGGIVPSPHAPIDPQLKTDILHPFDAKHLQAQSTQTGRAESMRPFLLASLPPTTTRGTILDAYVDKLLDLFKSDDFTDRVAAVYAKHLSDDDIKALIKFYETPAGQHFSAASPQLMGELNEIGQRLAMENMSRILKELCKEHPELQGVAKFCPAAEDKKSLLLLPDFPSMHNSFRPAAD